MKLNGIIKTLEVSHHFSPRPIHLERCVSEKCVRAGGILDDGQPFKWNRHVHLFSDFNLSIASIEFLVLLMIQDIT